VTNRTEKKLREAKLRVRRQDALMLQAAQALDRYAADNRSLQQRNDFWRNLLVASAFARGLGNERPISEAIEAQHPELFRLQP
jgi:hypothetical protein